MRNFFLAQALIFPAVASAEEKTTLMEPFSFGSMIQVFAGLIAVLLLFGGIVFILKRMGGFRASHAGNIQLVDGVSVSTRDRVVLLQVGEKQILIGVSPNGISPITVFDEPVITVTEKIENGFAGQLQKQIKDRLNPSSQNSGSQA